MMWRSRCRLLILALAPFIGSPSFSATSCSVATSDLVHHWAGNDNANDSVGAANGTVTGATFVDGRFGKAFSFDGVDDLVTFGATAGNFGTSDFTVLYWIRSPNTTRFEGVLGKREICGYHSFWDMRSNTTGPISMELCQDSGPSNYNSTSTTGSINDGDYHLFAAVREGATLRFLIDGLPSGENTTAAGVTNLSNTALLTAGRSTCTGLDGTTFFTGQLDEIQIYDRALSACDILASVSSGVDVDLDGSVMALSDALMLLRYAFGLRGAALVNAVVGTECIRCTAPPIEVYIASILSQLDVDGNSSVAALSDMLLLLRYAFGLRGAPLISGAVGAGCVRCTAPAIESHLSAFF